MCFELVMLTIQEIVIRLFFVSASPQMELRNTVSTRDCLMEVKSFHLAMPSSTEIFNRIDVGFWGNI
ncbi:hypothetical protein A9975_25085 [Cupriavidus sp. UME77]|nr:hypothetical protein [Cupriavidus sp. UME77]